MAEIDSEWTVAATPGRATTYKLSARDEPYLIAIDGKYVKVKVAGSGGGGVIVIEHEDPIVIQPDQAPFRESATRA